MPMFEISEGNSFAYEHIPPAEGGVTFTCFNALSGDKGMWLNTVGPALRDAGHGLLIWNFRGQPDTTYTLEQTDEPTIVADAIALLEQEKPVRPVHVGLSIGGLFAIRAHQHGGAGRAHGLVLINTLRKSTPRLDWVNNAVVRMAEVGGLDLMKDIFSPLLMNVDWQAQNRGSFLQVRSYTPVPDSDGTLMLLKAGIGADWNVNYEGLDVPVLSVTGMQDRVFLDREDVDELSARIPNLTRVDLKHAGHMIPVERPEALSDAMLSFAKALG